MIHLFRVILMAVMVANAVLIAASPQIRHAADLPPLISTLGVFADLKSLTVATDVIPYEVNSPLWSDGSAKRRWFRLPASASRASVGWTAQGPWTFPAGTLFIKQFDMNSATTSRRLETRILVVNDDQTTSGATYLWNQAGDDAARVDAAQLSTITGADGRPLVWGFPGRQDCAQCHTPKSGYLLAVTTAQLMRSVAGHEQIAVWRGAGIFADPPLDAELKRLVPYASLDDASASLEWRARSYLVANCAHCHLPDGTPAKFDARSHIPLTQAGLIGVKPEKPVAATAGADVRLVAPGHPNHSLLIQRMSTLAVGERMPPIASQAVDANAVALLREWIAAMPK